MSQKTWKVTQMQYFPQVDAREKVVFVVNWLLTATRDGVTAEISDVTNLTLDTSSNFIPYDQLTEAKVLEWVQAEIGPEYVQNYYAEIDKKLDEMLQPKLVAEPLPWEPKGYVPINLS